MATGTSLGFSLFSTWDGKGARQARKDLTGIQKVSADVGAMAKVAFGAAALGIAAYTGALIKAGIESNALSQRVQAGLKTTLGSSRAASDQLAKLREFGKSSPIALPVWLQAQQQMLAFGVEAEKVVPMLGAVQDAVIAAGGTEEEIKGVVRALGQMQSKGKLSAEELNQIGERGIDAAAVVAKAFGTTSQEIRTRITEGTISVDEFFGGFVKGSKMAFGGAADLAKQTFAGMIDRLKGAHRRLGEILATPLVDPMGGGALVEIGNAVADAMNNLEEALRPVIDMLGDQLEPAAGRAADSIRDFGESITTEGILGFFDTIRDGLPILSAFGTALGVSLGSQALELVPGLQRIAGAISPVALGFAALAATSPELRAALSQLGQSITPLLPIATSFALVIADVLTVAVEGLTPLLQLTASTVEFLAQNFWSTVPAVAAITTVLYYMAAAHGVNTAATLLAVLSVHRLRDAFIALRVAMTAHPILLIATLVAGLIALVGIMDDSGEAAQKWSADIQTALSQAASGAENDLDGIGSSLEKLQKQLEPTELSMMGLNNTFDELGRIVDGKIAPDPEDVQAWVDAANAVDEYMTRLVADGMSHEEIMTHLNEELGVSAQLYGELMPHLDDYLEAQVKAKEETQELAVALGDALMALQGYGDELKAQTDPYFALIKAQGEYQDALAKYNDVSSDVEATHADIEAAALTLTEAMIAQQIASEEAGTALGTELPQNLKDLAEAYDLPQSAIDILEQSFTDASSTAQSTAEEMVAANGEVAARYLETMGLMSSSVAEMAAVAAERLNQVTGSSATVEQAFTALGLQTGRTKDGFTQDMINMRDAGFDFNADIDKYLDGVIRQEESLKRNTKSTEKGWGTSLDGMSDKAEKETGFWEGLFRGIHDWFGKLGRGIRDLADKFSGSFRAMSGVTSSAWKSIQNSISVPVNFVVGTLYNKGIVSFWNQVSSAMFGGKNPLSAVKIPSSYSRGGGKRRARGGYTTGPGTSTSDSIPAWLSHGEYVVRAAAVKKIGVGTLDAINTGNAKLPGYFMGGFVDKAGGLIKGASKVFDALDRAGGSGWMGGWFDIAESAGKILGNIKGYLNIPSDGNSAPMRAMLKSGAQRVYDRLFGWFDQVKGAAGSGDHPMGYQAMFNWIKNVIPGTRLMSGFRAGDPGYHGRGQAVDLAFNDGSERRGGGKGEKAFNAISGAFRSGIAELIWDYSPLGYGVGIHNGSKHKWNSASAAPPSHNDHIHWAGSGGGFGSSGKGRMSGQWASTAAAALRAAGLFSEGNLSNVLRAIQKESSGNPRAINNWDSNARRGTPSMGLLQTIGPTFNAHAGKYRSRGAFDPFANIYAAIRYASSRYGSNWSSRMAAPGGYAEGGLVANSFDKGGYLPTGYSIAHNGTGRPEPVGHDLESGGGDTYIINIDRPVIASEREFEDMVTRAVTSASDKNRFRNLKINVKNK